MFTGKRHKSKQNDIAKKICCNHELKIGDQTTKINISDYLEDEDMQHVIYHYKK